MKFKTPWEPEIGKNYDIVVNGQIWSFTFDGLDPDDEEICFITWSTGEEEAHSKGELLPGIEEVDTLRAAGIVYPRGNSDEDQYQALLSIMTQPTYRFAKMVVPRALVLTCNFAPEYYIEKGRVRFNSEYMGFKYDPEKRLLNISSSDPDAKVPNWVMGRFPVSAIMRVEPVPGREETIFVLKIEEESI
ncbi:hypothetical protein H1230_17005 [Paenibacillus sp. 19GGS1-52]|uniref:hypothetical protein n=1 Tax=Paenibacillus sp. 19GGS1-52 TaxID=2758563 RepID=UPI001EFAD91D|nr:hypothetical protein [Paenibacillus sp. 19GGS1-52]ULO04844.1 hypothetical protein H1230_17005 [Paenibacillus sp. 19GGS1-52]